MRILRKTSSRHLQDIFTRHFLQDISKMSLRRRVNTSWRRLGSQKNVTLKTSSKHLQNVFTKTDVCWTNERKKSNFHVTRENLLKSTTMEKASYYIAISSYVITKDISLDRCLLEYYNVYRVVNSSASKELTKMINNLILALQPLS